MGELKKIIKSEIELRKKVLKLHELGLIPKTDVNIYLEEIQDAKNHEKVLNEIEKIISAALYMLKPLESKGSLCDILKLKKE
ncbi:hypothetical protein OD350_28665 (plasmid) [Clostridium beijerinckii]|uniref:hypothetical protein n=1 Tax=Clostridium beijerinckii TaxID=1520 RepID=UPI002226FF27|nr:hypothetical protein [Clostridium beijerinckii]UYZ39047.1 hypothetical protein OD350_28665 [Clostridium beijerinckii]